MLPHSFEQHVLVIRVSSDPGTEGTADLVTEVDGLVRAYHPSPVVLVLDARAATGAALSGVLRVHRTCSSLGVLLSVATPSARARRVLEADADSRATRLIIHARADTAVSTAALAACA
ncbi:hypothetical protein [Streptomyces sp. NPDC093094]|uniref:hypothetical protein n=1 Tax=Streptomyces sp. NPDC093094 TaxID=3366026 RepID=UPI003814E42C